MSILDYLSDSDVWQEFYEHKTRGEFYSAYEARQLKKFIDAKGYSDTCRMIEGKEHFPLPRVARINKKHSEKKRTVFIFDDGQNYTLKLISYLLYKYDNLFNDNLYSFRRKVCVKQAIRRLTHTNGNNCLYGYKVDIHDYFNSVDTELVISALRECIGDDERLVELIISILKEPRARNGKDTVEIKKGIMAGVPISGFLANIYLRGLDDYFEKNNILYARYSDDIIVFAKTKEEIDAHEKFIKDYLNKMKLTVNEKKEFRFLPGDSWEFLGFTINKDSIDVSPVSVKKLKDKMKRKARALVRWRKRNGKDPMWAVRAHIKHYNKKLYENRSDELTWTRWYFPTVTTAKSLHSVDEYWVSCLRYIVTGKYTKANYNLRYEVLKDLGYKSLVNEFYKFKKSNKDSLDTPVNPPSDI